MWHVRRIEDAHGKDSYVATRDHLVIAARSLERLGALIGRAGPDDDGDGGR
jgi:hypothetical protein